MSFSLFVIIEETRISVCTFVKCKSVIIQFFQKEYYNNRIEEASACYDLILNNHLRSREI